ncbi:MAG: type II toxin-antitoxin system VapC family toxin [bacterium]|nr:type II toxin-antitoxin system VapC family toxin [bacterium]
MSLYVLDTDHVTLHQRDHSTLHSRMAALRPRDLAVTIVTVEEQLRGWLKLIRRATSRERQVAAYRGLRIALEYFSSVPLLDFDPVAAVRFEELREQKIRIGTRDLRIAATVLAVKGILLTRNQRDFDRVPGLAIEDWSTAST